MYPLARGTVRTVLAATACLVGACPALAQVNANLNYAPNRRANATRDQAVLNAQRNAGARSFRYAPPVYTGGYGYNPYIGYVPTRAEGYLNGVANVTDSWGRYQQQIQGAKLDRQKAIQSSIDTRRQQFDERQYELANTPTLQDRLDKERQMRLREARDNATSAMITSGSTLNALLDNSQKVQSQGLYGPKIPLDPRTLDQISVSSPTTGGNAGMLQNGGKLDWPLAMFKPALEDGRKEIDKLLAEAVEQAGKYGKVDRALQAKLLNEEKRLAATVDGQVAALTPDEFIQDKRFLRELKDNLKILDDPNVGKFLGGTATASGSTVADLVNNMTSQGLTFGPAPRGSEGAYLSLYQSMRAYDVALEGLVSSRPAPGGTPPKPGGASAPPPPARP